MLENNIGIYDVVVDFDNIGKKDRSEIRYSENDINSARISIKCQFKGEDIDLTGCDILIRTQAGENRIEDAPSEIDVVNSIVKYIFPTNALINGVNHIEIMIVKGDWVKTSPKIYYRVFDGIGESDIVSETNYPILVSLIKDVQVLHDEVTILKNNVIEVNTNITTSESERVVSENQRKLDETIRIENENTRKTTFTSMQNDAAASLLNVDNKMNTVDSEFNIIKNTSDEKIRLIDTKVSEMNTLKEEVVVVKNNTESTRLATESVKTATNQVKIDTEKVKNDTLTVKNNTEAVRVATDKVKNDTLLVKSQAEEKIVNVENRMKTIEGTFDDLVGGTGFATKEYVDGKVAGLVNSAPETLDTLKELSDALGNDPNFSATVMAEIGKKANTNFVNEQLALKSNTTYVDAELVKKSNIGHVHTKSEITDFEHRHTMGEIDGLSLEANAVNYNKNGHINVDSALDSLFVDNESNKSSILELKQSVSNGKTKVATAITDKGVSTGSDASFDTMASNIGKIKVAKGNAVESDVLSGKTFTNSDGVVRAGNIPILTSNVQTPNHYMTGAIEVGQFTSGINNPCVYFQIPSRAYTNGLEWVMSSVPDLRSENILSGKNILGIWGNAIAGKRFANGSAEINRNNYTITVSGLAFTPSIVLVGLWHSDGEIQQTGCVYYKPVLGDVCFSFTGNSAYKQGVGNSTSSTVYVMHGGFRLPGTGTAGFGGSAYWIAFE